MLRIGPEAPSRQLPAGRQPIQRNLAALSYR